MKIKIYFVSIFLILFTLTQAQIIELTFTGKSGTLNVPLDSVYIKNYNYPGDTMLYFPDTTITLGTVGINEYENQNNYRLLQNYPNPFNGRTSVDIYLPEANYIDISVYNAIGKEVATFKNHLDKGFHSFLFSSGGESVYFFRAICNSEVKTITMLASSSGKKQQCELSYEGINSINTDANPYKSSKGFSYTFGDQLVFVGYTGAVTDTIIDSPTSDFTYEFEYAMGFPCPELHSFVYGNTTYGTLKIGSQCWMAQNLNIGVRINSGIGGQEQIDNGIIEKFCFTDLESTCDIYGGLYEWREMMNYKPSDDGALGTNKGICASGWHLPTDSDWDELTNYLGGMNIAGGKMKKTGINMWAFPNTAASDISGFTAIPGGYRYIDGNFNFLGYNGYFWSSTENDSTNSWFRILRYDLAEIGRYDNYKEIGMSVRCLKDTCLLMPTQANAGMDTLDILGDSIVLNANTPIIGNGFWTILSGIGGIFADPTDPTTMFYAVPDNIYYLIWSINNGCTTTSTDTVMLGFTSQVFVCGIPLIDTRDGQAYNTVQISNQCWMANNLNIGIRVHKYITQSDNGIIEKYCYSDTEDSCKIYGGLYQWDEMMNFVDIEGTEGICPSGWHLPTDLEWKELEGFLDSQFNVGDPEWDLSGARGTDVGGKLKESGTTHWIAPNAGATNSSGFTALPGGERANLTQSYYDINAYGFFWTSTDNPYYVYYRKFDYNTETSWRSIENKGSALSIRCLRY